MYIISLSRKSQTAIKLLLFISMEEGLDFFTQTKVYGKQHVNKVKITTETE